MPDHTEREREAVKRLRGQVSTPTTMTIAEREQYADALIAAVRAAVLAEVRAKVEAQDTFALDRGTGYGCGCEMKREPCADWLDRDEVLDALTALEATDAGRL